MSESTCKACHLPMRWHSLIQLKSCESLLQAQLNHQRLIAADRESRRKLEQKLEKQPTNQKEN